MLDDATQRVAASTTETTPGETKVDTPVRAEPAEESRLSVASQRQLIWWRFRKHKVALVGLIVIALFYIVAIGADFFAYSAPNQADGSRALIAPQPVRWFDHGGFSPHVHPLKLERDPATFEVHVAEDRGSNIPVRLFAHGYRYKLFGLF